MDTRTLTDTFSVSPQITDADLTKLKDQGVSCIIMNRPDGEEMGQPDTDALKAKASALGMQWVDIPIVSGQFTPDAVAAMADALIKSGGKTHAFCRTGTRSCFLWGLSSAMTGTHTPTDILSMAQEAGYDLSPAAAEIERLHANAR